MTAISETFGRLLENGERAYIPYLCAGDPDREFSLCLARALCRAGADLIELGMPFSDPVADGPTIQMAMNRSLGSGFNNGDLFSMLRALREDGLGQPIIVMSYYNTIISQGVEQFCTRLKDSGGNGVLVVDLPPEESSVLDDHARRCELDIIRLIAPTTDDSRLDMILSRASGFAYLVSVSGTTGARDSLPASVTSTLRRVVSRSSLPIALGFGLSRPEQVREAIANGAAGVVEGSKIISIYSGVLEDRQLAIELVEEHVREMKSATRLVAPPDRQ